MAAGWKASDVTAGNTGKNVPAEETPARNIKIHVAVPNDGWIHKMVAITCMQLVQINKGFNFDFVFNTDTPADNNRNSIIRDALTTDFDYLLFIDSDNPPRKNPLDLVALDKDVMIFPTPIWGTKEAVDFKYGANPIFWNCMIKHPTTHGWMENGKREGLQEIDAGGSGCMLIARRVLEAVKPAFIRYYDDDGCVTHGSDFVFCERAKEKGFRIWAHYDYPCGHFKEKDVADIYSVMKFRDISGANAVNINTPEYWDEQWKSRPERILPFYSKIVELLQARGVSSVLDFGCGRGDLLAQIPDTINRYGMDISEEAVKIVRGRGISAEVSTYPSGRWGAIVCTEVLEHLDNDAEMLKSFFEHTDLVIYSVPFNCLPPGFEKEHRRVYTEDYIHRITPYVEEIYVCDQYFLVVANRHKF